MLLVTWGDQSDDLGTNFDSSDYESKSSKFIAFIAKSNPSSLQGSSDKYTNDDTVDSHRLGEFSDEEHA